MQCSSLPWGERLCGFLPAEVAAWAGRLGRLLYCGSLGWGVVGGRVVYSTVGWCGLESVGRYVGTHEYTDLLHITAMLWIIRPDNQL